MNNTLIPKLKYVVFSGLILYGTSFADDQPETEQKPLWSNKLPEHNKKPQQNMPDLNIDTAIEFDRDLLSSDDMMSRRADEDSPDTEDLSNTIEEPLPSERASILTTPVQSQPSDNIETITEQTQVAVVTEKKVTAEPKVITLKQEPELVENTTTQSSSDPSNLQWKVISQAVVNYPKQALRLKKEGWVDLKVLISPQGTVKSSEVLNTSNKSNMFIRSAQQSVRRWRFTPPVSKGINEDVFSTVRVSFKLPQS